MLNSNNFSVTYDRIRNTWFGRFSTCGYGKTEVKIFEYPDGTLEECERKAGTDIKHGRLIQISSKGKIWDWFFKNGQLHGPSLTIFIEGHYVIDFYENG